MNLHGNQKNFGDVIESTYNKKIIIKKGIIPSIRRLFNRETESTIFLQEMEDGFEDKYGDLGLKATQLVNIGASILDVARHRPFEKHLAINYKSRYTEITVQIIESRIPLLMPINIQYFLHLNWGNVLSRYSRYVKDDVFFKKATGFILDIAQTQQRAFYAQINFLKSAEIMKKIIKDKKFSQVIYLEYLHPHLQRL